MESHVIAAADYRRKRWRNGLGWTREIALGGGGGDDWGWRMSIAEIDADSAFSVFPGVDREICLLSGNGLSLQFEDGELARLAPPHDRHQFSGERAVRAELSDGAVQVCNLMWRRDRFSLQLWHRPLAGSIVFFVEPAETWLLHLIAGRIHFEAGSDLPEMQGTDTAVLQAGVGGSARYALDGAGEALVARINPAFPAAAPIDGCTLVEPVP